MQISKPQPPTAEFYTTGGTLQAIFLGVQSPFHD